MSAREGRIVLVDDDRMFRKILVTGLSACGYTVDELDGAGDIVAEVLGRSPDVVLLDLELPGRNGQDVLKDLVAAGTDAKVIMVTGNEEVAAAVRAIRAGAFDYVTKPVKMDQLLVSLDRAVESGRVRRERDLYRDRYDRRHSYVESRNAAMRAIYGNLKVADAGLTYADNAPPMVDLAMMFLPEQPDFANARSVREAFEATVRRQAARLVGERARRGGGPGQGWSHITGGAGALTVITADDIAGG